MIFPCSDNKHAARANVCDCNLLLLDMCPLEAQAIRVSAWKKDTTGVYPPDPHGTRSFRLHAICGHRPFSAKGRK